MFIYNQSSQLKRPRLSAINLLIGLSIFLYIVSFFANRQLIAYLAFYSPLGLKQPWRIFTSAFLHAGIIHLAGNMIFLYMLGGLSRGRFKDLQILLIFFFSQWGGVCAFMLWTNLTQIPILGIGASAGVFGLCGALYLNLQHEGTSSAMISTLGGLIIVNVLLGFLIPGVGWQAHLGGLATGAVLGLAYRFIAIGAGRAGRKYLQAEIPDIVDRKKAFDATKRINRFGNFGIFLVALLLLMGISYLLSWESTIAVSFGTFSFIG